MTTPEWFPSGPWHGHGLVSGAVILNDRAHRNHHLLRPQMLGDG